MPVLVRSDGVHTIGYSNEFPGYAEHMLLSSQLLLPVRNGLSAAEAALTEPMAVGRHAVEKSVPPVTMFVSSSGVGQWTCSHSRTEAKRLRTCIGRRLFSRREN